MAGKGYKKYMKKNSQKDMSLWKLFAISFFGMLLVFTFLIKSFTPSVDVSIGDYKQEEEFDNSDEIKKIVDGRLALIQNEDQGKDFTEIMRKEEEKTKNEEVVLRTNNEETVFGYSWTSTQHAQNASKCIVLICYQPLNPNRSLNCYALMKPSFCPLFRYFSITMEPFR